MQHFKFVIWRFAEFVFWCHEQFNYFEILYSFNFSADSWQPVNITYDNPEKYSGLHIEGWPPGKDRQMPNYIKPDQDTFSLRPSKAHFKGCEILVIVHSAIDSFSMRRGLRDTWIQFVTQKRVANVSVIFLIGNMATPVVEFSREGYKIRNFFA